MSEQTAAAYRILMGAKAYRDGKHNEQRAIQETADAYIVIADQIAEVRRLCQQHAHPGCNSGAHALASAVLKLIGE